MWRKPTLPHMRFAWSIIEGILGLELGVLLELPHGTSLVLLSWSLVDEEKAGIELLSWVSVED